MTITDGVSEEAAVEPAGDLPVQALAAAARDGLLDYHGYVSGDRYEITILDQDMIVAGAEVGPFVARLRSIEKLRAEGVDVRLVALNGVEEFTIEPPAGHRLRLRAIDVPGWAAGFLAAREGGPSPRHTHDSQAAEIAALFASPSLNDQCRMVILGLMYGHADHRPVSTDSLREMMGNLPGVDRPPAKKTVLDALKFGGYLSSQMARLMISAFGMRWSVTARGGVEWADGRPVADGALPEMPGLARLRLIVKADQAGWVRYLSAPSPNRARRLKEYSLGIGDRVHVVAADVVAAWLAGVEAFHQL